MVVESFFVELGIILTVAIVVSFIMRALKQPLIIGYIITGVILSPILASHFTGNEILSQFSDIGIAILLFTVGINLSPKSAKEVGMTSLIVGLGQLILMFGIGLGLGKLLGFSMINSLYIGIALTFSSTIIIIKLLSDKQETTSVYGRITIGVEIIQDIAAIVVLMAISSISSGGDILPTALRTILIGIALMIIIFVISYYILPVITRRIAKSQEFLLLFSLGWAFALGSLFYVFNISIEIGALLAGVTLSLSPYRFEIASKIRPLRDFFILIFFIFLGTKMSLGSLGDYIIPIVVLSAAVFILKPLIVMAFMGGLGYTKRNIFLTGITISQISEFSFIIVGIGMPSLLPLVTVIGLITMAGSSYGILNSNKLYKIFSPLVKMFERKNPKADQGKYHNEERYDIILFGYNRIGYDLVESLKKKKKTKFLIVDYNPETILGLVKQGIDCRYGDAGDVDLLNDLNLKSPKMVVSTIPDPETNLLLTEKVKSQNEKSIIIVVAHQIEDAISLYNAGASYVITPHFLGGYHAAKLIETHGFKPEMFLKEKETHLKTLNARKNLGHEHPTYSKDH